jgi:hypothetical protein
MHDTLSRLGPSPVGALTQINDSCAPVIQEKTLETSVASHLPESRRGFPLDAEVD